MNSLKVDDLQFEVRWSDRRKTVGITVDRNGELVLSAPTGCDHRILEKSVRNKRQWIYEKLAQKEANRHRAPEKEYVSGEGFFYLGRSYRLLLVERQNVPVKLFRGRFRMRRSDAGDGRRHMIRWYSEHALPWITRCVERYEGRIGVTPTNIKIRNLGYRWGSCGKRGTLYFNWKTILLPPRIVEYVVVHELVHLHEAHHTSAFWRRVERTMPDYEERKNWLPLRGAEYATE
jgi:predicted metal-dependent hydrolase